MFVACAGLISFGAHQTSSTCWPRWRSTSIWSWVCWRRKTIWARWSIWYKLLACSAWPVTLPVLKSVVCSDKQLTKISIKLFARHRIFDCTGYLTGSQSNILYAISPVKFCHRSNAPGHDRSNIRPCDGRMFDRSWPVKYPAGYLTFSRYVLYDH